MRALNDSEVKAIQSTLESITSNREIVALAAYGSQVAGYATKESDYDVVLVVKPFTQRIKYYYMKGETECSALVVDPKSFESDCKKSTLGEFVSGRLLNPYYPIAGEQYLRNNEIAFKKRVLLEGLSEAYAENSEFSAEIIFPLKYFLYEKLRKRAAIYPPVVYSYSRTYGESLLKDNLENSLMGFRDAAKELMKEGLIDYDKEGDSISVPLNEFNAGLSARIEAAASYTNKSLRQYAVHGYAGRVTLNVVGKEVISKISRSRKSGKLPDYILNPKQTWTISSGKLFAMSQDWLSDMISYFEMEKTTCKVTSKSLGEFYNSAGFYTFEDGDRAISVAVKRYQDVKGIKWGVLNLWSLKSANFTTNPMERIFREYRTSRELKQFGLNTAEVLAVFLDQKMLVTSFIAGKDLSKLESEYLNDESDDLSPFEMFGMELAKMHNNGYCMGDTKPSNVILCGENSKMYFTDLEQALPDGNKTWDVAEFIYYSVRLTLKEDRVRRLVSSFLKGYISVAEDKSVVRKSESFRYRAPFQAFISPNIMNALRNDLKNYATSAS
ncbi:MAG: nucleotidyltransferase domain-containing protein, partial [Nitrososphaerales archaeon]